MKCPYCGKDNADKAKTCERCSAGLPVKEETTLQLKKAEKKSEEMNKNGT